MQNLAYHQMRFERTRSLELGLQKHPRLNRSIPVPQGLERGLFKCRVSYGERIDLIEFEPYANRVVESIRLVESNTIKYDFKYSDRSELDKLFILRGNCDDILIIKNGCITDSYLANVVFWDGAHWYTPDTPLLQGTMRARLLDEGRVIPRRIKPGDLEKFEQVRLINAMNGLEDGQGLPIGALRY